LFLPVLVQICFSSCEQIEGRREKVERLYGSLGIVVAHLVSVGIKRLTMVQKWTIGESQTYETSTSTILKTVVEAE